ncbi:hypothetical protein ACXU4B_08420 [Dyella soli]|uniref:Tetratricopeptide repeat protein n=1 Tax=Dyella soli TaxID=522319 RepID=A0A4R0YPU9_9GAMM|nr:hypothetical protein [Dyella soli]TCI10977.1 hypothetical protein EZM97_19315 [Dyella soli]
MQRKTLLASGLAMLMAGAATFASAQAAAPAAPPAKVAPAAKAAQPGDDGGHDHDFMGGRGAGMGHAGMDGHHMGGPGSAVIEDLRALERLYLASGRAKELPALYNEVLAKSQDPGVRTYVYHHLARAQMAPANPDQAIATLRKSLDENLANDARRRAEFEKMRSEWEQRHAPAKPAAATASQP